ncbi:MAG: DUF3800 domain-containing protein [Acidobacteria bacterium]|nr:DUF3800 domain-containing protein [Acidobacteriota bacterium]
MQLCYVDESGTPDVPGNSSHFVLAGLAIPIRRWKNCDAQIHSIKRNYSLEKAEVHVAWLLRPYLEQTRIAGFESLTHDQRRSQVQSARTAELLRLQRVGNSKRYHQTRKNYSKTLDYIHLTDGERRRVVLDIAKCVSGWEYARLFAECVDKLHFDPSRTPTTIDEQAFEQIVSRFERYLRNVGEEGRNYGLLIHDNNQTVARRHTLLMKRFHQRGTLWTQLNHIIETPLFVDSELTSLVQVADLCGYAIRRYLENDEEPLFDLVFQRADRHDGRVVGVRHFTSLGCLCKICISHSNRPLPVIQPT